MGRRAGRAGAQSGLDGRRHRGFQLDATTARNAAATILQQHPDVCGIVDFWDATAQGTASAIRDAGLKDKIFLATTGSGEAIDCKLIEDGTFGAIVTSELPRQSQDVVAAIKILLQSGIKPGDSKNYLYTHEIARSKKDLTPDTCWSQAAIEAAAKK